MHCLENFASLVYAFLPTLSRFTRFSPSQRFPVCNVFWNPVSGILCPCPYRMSCLFISSTIVRYLHNFPDSFICYSFQPRPLRQKSIFVSSNIRFSRVFNCPYFTVAFDYTFYCGIIFWSFVAAVYLSIPFLPIFECCFVDLLRQTCILFCKY